MLTISSSVLWTWYAWGYHTHKCSILHLLTTNEFMIALLELPSSKNHIYLTHKHLTCIWCTPGIRKATLIQNTKLYCSILRWKIKHSDQCIWKFHEYIHESYFWRFEWIIGWKVNGKKEDPSFIWWITLQSKWIHITYLQTTSQQNIW